MGKSSKSVDWVTLQAQWEAGTPVSKLSKRHKVSAQRIYKVKKRDQWTPRFISAKDAIVAASTPNVDAKENQGVKTIGKGRSIGQPIGDEGRDRDLLSEIQAVVAGRAPDNPAAAAILDQAATEIELMRQHRRSISRASVVAENILTRLHALVIDGQAADVITFETKKGEAFHRVPFLGDRESVSDALLKCVNAIAKLVPLERQAHGLTDSNEDKMPTIQFNMPNVKVISVNGKGEIIKRGQRGVIEGQAEPVATP